MEIIFKARDFLEKSRFFLSKNSNKIKDNRKGVANTEITATID